MKELNFATQSKLNANTLARMYAADPTSVNFFTRYEKYLKDGWVCDTWTAHSDPSDAGYYSMVGEVDAALPSAHWWDGEADTASSEQPEDVPNPELWCFFPDFLRALKLNWVRSGGVVVRVQRAIKLARAAGWDYINLEMVAELTGISQFNTKLNAAWDDQLSRVGACLIHNHYTRLPSGSFGPAVPWLSLESMAWTEL